MSTQNVLLESTELHTDTAPPFDVFILPPLVPPRRDGLTVLVLADGNTRSSPGGGYAGGARRVVSIAEHLARRRDVAVMVACILSPDNIAKRSDRFFFEVYKEFIELGVAIETRGALIDAGIRLDPCGDLGSLRARGGHASDLADAVVAVAELTARVADPALRLLLGVGYGPDTARELDVDVVVRTGMEEPGVLRLSGLGASEGVVHCAMTTLWPDVEPGAMDDVIDRCKERATSRFAGGHSASVIADFIERLSSAAIRDPVRVTIPVSAPPAAADAALCGLVSGLLGGRATIAVEHAAGADELSSRYGPARGAKHIVRVVGGSPWGRPGCAGEFDAILAPGQEAPSFLLPGWLTPGSANVHACVAAGEGMVRGLGEALRFAAAHPPLRGRDRALGCVAVSPGVAEARPAVSRAPDRDELGDRFAGKTLRWAASAGFVLPNAAWQNAAANYALTAFFIHFRIPTEWDEAGTLWEERADLTARYMLLVAAGDEAIFDRVLDSETPEQRWVRLEASARFLQGALQIEGARPCLPHVPANDLLAAIAGEWRALFDRYRRSCLPAAAAGFRIGLADLYAASLAEHRVGLALGLPEGLVEGPVGAAAIRKRFDAVPHCIAARACELVGGAWEGGRPVPKELLALLYLAEVASAIGAGLLFRTAALTAPPSTAASHGIHLLNPTATLLDYHVRLSNDLSGFLDSPGGDRDPKENACTVLVPRSASGAARAAATVQALATCRRLAAWVGREVGGRIDQLATAWPWMGTILRRGAFVGRRVYEVGHYTTVSRSGMSAIFDEADEEEYARRLKVVCKGRQRS